jgi:hypothetical protein
VRHRRGPDDSRGGGRRGVEANVEQERVRGPGRGAIRRGASGAGVETV